MFTSPKTNYEILRTPLWASMHIDVFLKKNTLCSNKKQIHERFKNYKYIAAYFGYPSWILSVEDFEFYSCTIGFFYVLGAFICAFSQVVWEKKGT